MDWILDFEYSASANTVAQLLSLFTSNIRGKRSRHTRHFYSIIMLLINCIHIGLGIGLRTVVLGWGRRLRTVILGWGRRPKPHMTVWSPIPRPIWIQLINDNFINWLYTFFSGLLFQMKSSISKWRPKWIAYPNLI